MLFFIKNILWNQKKAVILHAELRTLCSGRNQNAFFLLIFLGG